MSTPGAFIGSSELVGLRVLHDRGGRLQSTPSTMLAIHSRAVQVQYDPEKESLSLQDKPPSYCACMNRQADRL